MATTTVAPPPDVTPADYRLDGPNATRAVERGLAEADWYQCPVPRDVMRELLERRDGPAIRDAILWFGLLGLAGGLGIVLFLAGSWWAILPFVVYGLLYGTCSDSRWHESSHGTAFRTDWLNDALYEIASFMVMRESTYWRWSHTRHHSDTIILGRDPEIAVPRPPSLFAFVFSFTGIPAAKDYFRKVVRHAVGHIDAAEASFLPASAYGQVIWRARIYLLIYAAVIAACFAMGSILPLLLIGGPNIYGYWLMPIYGYTQHAGLAENVLDHRLNCRTVYMNIVHRFLYLNMNYHVEHHMFPQVPYHNLPRLHAVVKDDMPRPYTGILAAWREIIAAILRQRRDPAWYVKRELPSPSVQAAANVAATTITADSEPDADGWVAIGATDLLEREDVLRFDCGDYTFAVYRTADDSYYATDGICTHGNTHLATGKVMGHQIECPKHNGRFDVRDGSPQRAPVCVRLRTYPVRVADGRLAIDISAATQTVHDPEQTTYTFRVVSNHNVATFIKELVLEPLPGGPVLTYESGQYLQLDIPAYGLITFDMFAVDEPFAEVWRVQHVTDYAAENHTQQRRNYSMATNSATDSQLRFNVRIATPPRGQDCNAGVGSSYVWQLKPGDTVSAIGPFGDFRIKDTKREMVYLGGGSGMAPLRSHLAHLFETLGTKRRVSFWYGARSRQELFYTDYFEQLAAQHANFSFHPALSEPLPDDDWDSHTGYIHEVLWREYLAHHPDSTAIEYYFCGPQPMIQAARSMLIERGVPADQIAFDEF